MKRGDNAMDALGLGKTQNRSKHGELMVESRSSTGLT